MELVGMVDCSLVMKLVDNNLEHGYFRHFSILGVLVVLLGV